MPISTTKTIQFEFKLFDSQNKPIDKMEVIIQYYNVMDQLWVNAYSSVINKGVMLSEQAATSKVKTIISFLDILKSNHIPGVRLVPSKPIYGLKKQEVLASLQDFNFDEKKASLVFNFGTAYLLEKEYLPKQDLFKDFILVANSLNLATSQKNEATIANLQADLTKLEILQKSRPKETGTTQLTDVKVIKQISTLEDKVKSAAGLQSTLQKSIEEKEALIVKLNAQIKSTSTSNTSFEKENVQFSNDIKSLTAANKEILNSQKVLTETLKQKEDDLKVFDLQIKAQLKQVAALEKEKAANMQGMATLETNFANQKKVSGVLEETIKRINIENKDLTKSLEKLKADNLVFQENIKQLNQDKAFSIASFQKSLNQKDELLVNKEKELKESIARNAALFAQKEQLQKQVDELGKNIDFENRPISIDNVYKNVVRDFDTASKNNTGSYQISNLSLKLKTIVGNDANGLNVQFLSKENLAKINAGALSELIMDLSPAPKPDQSGTGNLPNLIGFTETAVRRILQNYGLRLNPVYQNNPAIVNGDSFKQSPAPKSETTPNQIITVIFSKNE